MKKREFLAMGGAVPLMLAGCGGSGSGSAPVRLVNASVGYPLLGFMVESTQATTADVAYGATSPYENVQAGAVGITLTVGNQSATAAQVRTVNKDNRYSLVAYGVLNGLRLALVTESTIVPDVGKANVNVLNTSVDIGPVDVYLSAGKDLSAATLIASSIQASSTSPAQSAFAPILAGSYFVTVVGANSIAQGLSDVRFQTPTAITLTALQVLTIVLTPGGGGVLANAIMLTQGTTGTATSYLNSTARVRAVTAIPGPSISVVGATAAGTAVTVLAPSTTQQYSNYFVVGTGTPPTVLVGGVAVPVVMEDATGTTEVAGSLAAGGDYTLMVYLDASNVPKGKLIADDNTAPVTSSGLKFRLINLASDNQGLQLSMLVNKLSIASNITYATASKYKEISVPQGTSSTVQVNNGAQAIISETSPLTLPNIFTEIVVSVPSTGNVLAFFSSASGTD